MNKIFSICILCMLFLCYGCVTKQANEIKQPEIKKTDSIMPTKIKDTAIIYNYNDNFVYTDSTKIIYDLSDDSVVAFSERYEQRVFLNYDRKHEMPEAIELYFKNGKKYKPILLKFIIYYQKYHPFYEISLKSESSNLGISIVIGGSPRKKEIFKRQLNNYDKTRQLK